MLVLMLRLMGLRNLLGRGVKTRCCFAADFFLLPIARETVAETAIMRKQHAGSSDLPEVLEKQHDPIGATINATWNDRCASALSLTRLMSRVIGEWA
jgi:hypothetical protein